MAKAREISKNAFSLTTDRCLYGHVNLQNQSVDDTAVAMVSLGSPQRHAAGAWAAAAEEEVEDGGGTRPMWPPSPSSTFLLHLAASDHPRRRTHSEGEGLLLALASSVAVPLKVANAPEPASWRGNRAAALPPRGNRAASTARGPGGLTIQPPHQLLAAHAPIGTQAHAAAAPRPADAARRALTRRVLERRWPSPSEDAQRHRWGTNRSLAIAVSDGRPK